MKPYLKAEMMYGLRVLLSIVEDSNSGILTKENAVKRLKEVKFLGDLTGTHLFAVAVQRGLLINRDYLTKPLVPLTLCDKVRKHLFDDDKSITKERIRKATEMASEKLGLHMIAGEHALCESIRASKGKSPGNDAHHKDQDLVWISTDSRNNDNILTEVRVGLPVMHRSESHDRILLQLLPKEDSNEVKHRWWLPNPNRTECLAHFVKECLANSSNVMEVLHSSAKGMSASSMDEERDEWRKYITMKSNRINLDALPEEVRNLHKVGPTFLAKTTLGHESPSMKVNACKKRKMSAITMVKKQKEKDGNFGQMTTYACKSNLPGNDVKEAPQMDMNLVTVKLATLAQTSWMDRYGQVLPELNPRAENYRGVGTLWTPQTIDFGEELPIHMNDYPPSVLDETAIPIPNQDGVGFRRVKEARNALYWWIICSIQLVESRRHWAKEVLGERRSVIIVVHPTIMWCTLWIDNSGSFWVGYKGRKCMFG
jgi:hypothetical protein